MWDKEQPVPVQGGGADARVLGVCGGSGGGVASINAVILYSPHIFKIVGITRKSYLSDALIAAGLVKTVSIFVATLLADKIGRRPLLPSSVTRGIRVWIHAHGSF
ncbi:General substrate transporter [Macleaya cordata]|uniref:General substrate transporter n=1 Tax=Macleaya cordata TaxID=56857 RepID=A0A200QVT5_MACCD|nr:General substrate transporter [Macleaya cordata]